MIQSDAAENASYILGLARLGNEGRLRLYFIHQKRIQINWHLRQCRPVALCRCISPPAGLGGQCIGGKWITAVLKFRHDPQWNRRCKRRLCHSARWCRSLPEHAILSIRRDARRHTIAKYASASVRGSLNHAGRKQVGIDAPSDSLQNAMRIVLGARHLPHCCRIEMFYLLPQTLCRAGRRPCKLVKTALRRHGIRGNRFRSRRSRCRIAGRCRMESWWALKSSKKLALWSGNWSNTSRISQQST